MEGMVGLFNLSVSLEISDSESDTMGQMFLVQVDKERGGGVASQSRQEGVIVRERYKKQRLRGDKVKMDVKKERNELNSNPS